MLTLKNNEAPPAGYSYVYLETVFCDNGKPCLVYPGRTESSVDCRVGKRMSDSYYESVGNYNDPINRLTRLMGADHIKTTIIAVVKTEFASYVEHMLIRTYGNISVNVVNSKNEKMDLTKLVPSAWILKLDPKSRKPVDSFEDIQQVLDETGCDLEALNDAIENDILYDGYYWTWSNNYVVPPVLDDLYPVEEKRKARDFTIKGELSKWIRERESSPAFRPLC